VKGAVVAVDAAWFVSPAKLASALAVPASVLDEYVTVRVLSVKPSPASEVAVAVHGVIAAPV
jgi:hypothetical protein